MQLKVGLPKESLEGEARVALLPEHVQQLICLGFVVYVESGAGVSAGFCDASYEAVGATVTSRQEAFSGVITVKLNPPTLEEVESLTLGSVLISFIFEKRNEEVLRQIAAKRITLFAMDAVPRTARAQSVDALSAMSQLLGYRAIILAASTLGRVLPGQITAAGRFDPARVLVIGAGVAGLSAIGTARSLGAEVLAYDARLDTKEQVESLGAVYLGSARSRGRQKGGLPIAVQEQLGSIDILVTAAGGTTTKAPRLLTAAYVEKMKPGSLIVDLAVEQGGNCELTQPGKNIITPTGVHIFGTSLLCSSLSLQASQLYGQTLLNFLKLLHTHCTPERLGETYRTDHLLDAMAICADGKIKTINKPLKSLPVVEQIDPSEPIEHPEPLLKPRWPWKRRAAKLSLMLLIFAGCFYNYATPALFNELFIFVIACFSGYALVWQIPPALHTPLMSLTNAISGIIIIGMLVSADQMTDALFTFNLVAMGLTIINIVGGFVMTHRMLTLFKGEQA